MRRLFFTIILLGAFLTPASALAEQDRASCMGIEASAISPPGTSAELPGGAPELNQVVREIATAQSLPPGAIRNTIARLREGSHEACDAALGE